MTGKFIKALLFHRKRKTLTAMILYRKIENVCIPRQNILLLRYKFFICKQREAQSFNEFMAQLKKSSSDCEFGELKNPLNKHTVVIGIVDESLREKSSESQI